MTDIVIVPPIPPIPTPPSTNDPANFSVRADAFLGILPDWSDALNGVAVSARTNAIASTEQATASAGSATAAATSASAASAYATIAANAPTTYGTTAQSLTISAGSISFTVEPNRAFVSGQAVVIAANSNPVGLRMFGIVTAYTAASGAITISVSAIVGSGTYAGWTVTLGNAPAAGGLTVANVASNLNAAAGVYYVFTASGVTLTMPTSPALGAEIGFCNASTGNVFINWNGRTVKSVAPAPQSMVLPRYGSAVVKFNGSTWA